MKKILISFIFLTLIFSCSEKEEKKGEKKIIIQKDEKIRVEGKILTKRDFKSYGVYPGILKEWDNFTVSPQFTGNIEYMPYELNDYIKKGTTVIKINSSILSAQIEQLKIAKKNIDINYNRVLKLYEKNLTTKSKLDAITAKKEDIEANLRVLELNLSHSIVKSPFNGYVIKKWNKKGELALAGRPVITLAKFDKIKLLVTIPEKDIFKVSKGDILSFTLEADKKEYKAMVYRISQISDPASHTVPVELEINNFKDFNGNFVLKPGMLAKVKLILLRKLGFVVPMDSILKTEKGNFIFISNNNNIIKKIKIKIISTQGDFALIEGELKENEKLVTKGIYELNNNSKVEFVKLNEAKIKKNYSKILFLCKKESDNLNFIRKLLNSKMEIIDFFKSKIAYELKYKDSKDRKIFKSISSCIVEEKK